MRKKYVYIITLILLFYFLSHVKILFAQNYLIHTYSENDGLINSKIYDVKQDLSGRMWFATRGGISVYDGYNWTSHTVKDGLQSIAIKKLKVDEKGIVWALPYHPSFLISYYLNNSWKSIPDKFPGDEIITSFEVIYFKNKRCIAVSTSEKGLSLYENDKWINLNYSNSILSDRINGMTIYQGVLYIVCDKGVFIYDGEKIIEFLKNEITLPSKNVLGIAIEKRNENDKIWLAGKNWVGYISDKKFHLVSDEIDYIYTSKENPGLFILPDYKSGVFIGNIYELCYFNMKTKTIELLNQRNGLNGSGSTSLFLDREGNIWVTNLRGVSKIVSRRFKNFKKKHGLFENEVTAILEYKTGKFIFGHVNGITYFDGQNFETKSFHEKFGINVESRVLDISKDQDDNIWLAVSKMGIAKIDKSGIFQWYRKPFGHNFSVNSVLVDNFNNMWCTSGNSIRILKNKKFVRIENPKKSNLNVRKMFKGLYDDIYFATVNKGVYHFQDDGWTQYSNKNNISANSVYAIFADSNEKFWVGTLAGLYIISENQIIKVDTIGLEINRPVYSILKDANNNMWFGTDNGVIKWNGRQTQEHTVHNGFVGQETNRSASILDSQNRVWIGTDLGVSCYQADYDYDIENIASPIVELSLLEAGDKKYTLKKIVKLNYDENNLVFHFKIISLIDEKANGYRCKLDGFDKEWLQKDNIRNLSVRYTNIPSGIFNFQIQAKNSLGLWSNIVTSSEIVVKKPFWAEIWFYLLAIMFCFFFVFFGMSYFSKKRNLIKLAQLVEERTAELKKSEKRLRKQNKALMCLTSLKTLKCGELNKTIAKIIEVTSHILQIERVSVWLFKKNSMILECYDLYERSKNRHTSGLVIEIDKCPEYFKAVKSERAISVPDVRKDIRMIELLDNYFIPLNIYSLLDATIRNEGEVLGIVCCEHVGTLRIWSYDEDNFAGSIADLVTIALETMNGLFKPEFSFNFFWRSFFRSSLLGQVFVPESF